MPWTNLTDMKSVASRPWVYIHEGPHFPIHIPILPSTGSRPTNNARPGIELSSPRKPAFLNRTSIFIPTDLSMGSGRVTSIHSVTTRSFSVVGAAEENHRLREHVYMQIHDHIIQPILLRESLEDPHPLIRDVPRRIRENNISNLCNLEKTVIFLAPVSSIGFLFREEFKSLLWFQEVFSDPDSVSVALQAIDSAVVYAISYPNLFPEAPHHIE